MPFNETDAQSFARALRDMQSNTMERDDNTSLLIERMQKPLNGVPGPRDLGYTSYDIGDRGVRGLMRIGRSGVINNDRFHEAQKRWPESVNIERWDLEPLRARKALDPYIDDINDGKR